MKKQAVYFVETKEGERLYKLDTLWSTGGVNDGVKVHTDSEDDKERFFNSLCSYFKPWDYIFYNERLIKIRERYTNSKYGYQVILSEQQIDYLQDQELSKPIYLKLIQEINDDFIVKSVDYTPYDRDTKIDLILNESN